MRHPTGDASTWHEQDRLVVHLDLIATADVIRKWEEAGGRLERKRASATAAFANDRRRRHGRNAYRHGLADADAKVDMPMPSAAALMLTGEWSVFTLRAEIADVDRSGPGAPATTERDALTDQVVARAKMRDDALVYGTISTPGLILLELGAITGGACVSCCLPSHSCSILQASKIIRSRSQYSKALPFLPPRFLSVRTSTLLIASHSAIWWKP